MADSLPELPYDLASCQLLIRQLQAEAQRAAEQLANGEARVQHAEAQLAEYRETVARYEETVEQPRPATSRTC